MTTLTVIINLPSNFTASTTAIMSQLFTDLSDYTLLIIGVILGLTVIGVLIGFLTQRH